MEFDLYKLEIIVANQPRKFRLDSYGPVHKIRVPRKATTFDNITEKTWRSYVEEIDAKYPAGAVIRRPGRSTHETLLEGSTKILEVPASNRNSPLRDKFEAIASRAGVIVEYKQE